ncbi:hypothetical protein IV203_010457 [Nitzschia inconspicua]|uniref:Fungal lipase-like domain-containing protein n=1 Tax=Nitzschia inconspicua TaxID=303405 RepID=A0A9K3KX47_9STRA|nr:hypothetical protein IV203_010457 [Nitzschia inconspicua]
MRCLFSSATLSLLYLVDLEAATAKLFSSKPIGPEYCVRPSERARCEHGTIGDGATCNSLVCYNNDSLCSDQPDEKDQFLKGCYIVEGVVFLQTCKGILAPAKSRRDNPVDCYNGHGIEIIHPPRGNCEAGGCCDLNGAFPLCDLESKMAFTSLGYGIDATDTDACSSSIDRYGPNGGCKYLSDSNSNEALLCNNIGAISTEEADQDMTFCHVSFAGTNDVENVLAYVKQVFDILARRSVSFGEVSFTLIEALASIALGSMHDKHDGLVEIVYNEAQAMGCFDGPGAAISLYGHSLGGSMADILALMIGGLQPDVHVEISTLNAPALLVEPLEGQAARLPVWDRKHQYITGLVMPRGPVFKDVFVEYRAYGFYQDYDVVSQVFPGGFYANSTGTNVEFMCEVLSADGTKLEYFLSPGWMGCAHGRSDVLNKMPDFPHLGGLERNDESQVDENLRTLLWILPFIFGKPIDPKVVEALNVVATIADVNLRESFWLITDLHMMRRALHFANLITDNGRQCNSQGFAIDLA